MALDDVLEKIVERLPYSDGAARRRLIAGSMLAVGVAVPNWESISKAIGGLSLSDLLRTPLLTAVAALFVYLAGTVVEMCGSVFLVPAAAWMFKVVSFGRIPGIRPKILSPGAHTVLESFPAKVQDGILWPSGTNGELALQHLVQTFRMPRNRKWCRQLFSRVADIATTTTAVISVVTPIIFAGALQNRSGVEDVRYWNDATRVGETFEGFGEQLLQANQLAAKDNHRSEPYQITVTLEKPELRETLTSMLAYFDARRHGQRLYYFDRAGVASLTRLALQIGADSQDDLEHLRASLSAQSFLSEQGQLYRDLLFLKDSALVVGRASSEWELSAAAVTETRLQRRRLMAETTALLPALLLLYGGFFISQRNGLLSALEVRAIEDMRNGSSVGNTASEAVPGVNPEAESETDLMMA